MKIDKMLTIQKSPTHDELYEGCRRRKPKAQKALYDNLAPKMLGVCLRYLKDKEEAEHVMIGGFVKVFEKIDQYKGDGSFEGWIRRIMVNESLMYLRRSQPLSVDVDIAEVEGELDYDQLDQSLNAEDLLKLITELPVGYKTVFNLYAIEGFNHAEIAEKLGISENTSKSQLSRARKLLQAKLAKLEYNSTLKVSTNGNQ
ncbi:MAG: sigma-70 family RNA polymerase sigma factor [Bacteroidota bacterium]